MINAIDLLKSDHRKVLDLLKQVDHTTEKEGEKRNSLFKTIKAELGRHEKIEEKVFYPAVLKKERPPILEAYEEHHLVNVILAEMENLETTNERWTAKFCVLRDTIAHHVEEEEKEIFPKAQKFLDNEKLNRMGDEMEEIKADRHGDNADLNP